VPSAGNGRRWPRAPLSIDHWLTATVGCGPNGAPELMYSGAPPGPRSPRPVSGPTSQVPSAGNGRRPDRSGTFTTGFGPPNGSQELMYKGAPPAIRQTRPSGVLTKVPSL